jgi:hypothetical protein
MIDMYWHFYFILKGRHLGFFQKPFAASEAQNNKMLCKSKSAAWVAGHFLILKGRHLGFYQNPFASS